MPDEKMTNSADAPLPQGNLIFALDIGTRTVVGILGEQNDDIFNMIDYVVEPHTKRAMVDGQVEDIKQVAKIVAKAKARLEERNNIKLTHVSIAAAGRALRTSRIEVEFDITEKDTINEEQIKSMEIETIQRAQQKLDEERKGEKLLFYCVGHSIVKYTLDGYKILTLAGHKGAKASIELIAAFLPSVVVEGLYAVMDLNGLEVASLTLEPIAAMNILIPPEIRLINIALVDIGAGTSDIAIARDGSIVAYAMATTAGDEITEEIIKAFFVDFDTAEQMKQSCGTGAESFEYKDIFGLSHTIKTTAFFERILPAVEMLASTICDAITEVNDGAPAAVFLVGGGALVAGLPHEVASRLGIDETHVAVGNQAFLKNVSTGGETLGAEFITPLGIGVTSVLNQGYDFSVISLNGEKIRIFDTKQLSVFELLSIAGYKSMEIMGRSGHNLTYSLNGRRTIVKGGALTPAEVTVNGTPASLTARVTQGDRVNIVKAVCGEDASATISDVIDLSRYQSGFVTFGGEKKKIGIELYAGGERVDGDYSIKPLDEITYSGALTLSDLLDREDIEVEGVGFTANGKSIDYDYILKDGDIIEYSDEFPEPITAPNETGDYDYDEDVPAEAEKEIETTYEPELYGEIVVSLNNNIIRLPESKDKTPHVFIELLNYVELDLSNRRGDYILQLNGNTANFNDMLRSGDTAVIRWAD